MSYTHVTVKRSNRYPLMGLGCACSPTLGDSSAGSPGWLTTSAVLLAAGGILAGIGHALKKNRRRRN